MQLYAFDINGEFVSAQQAFRQTDYQCFECQHIVRLRGGPHRQRHFYHVEPIPSCRQHQKGPVHMQLQSYFFQHLPLGDCQLEHAFPSIGRIADVTWHSKKIIFEIQCSAISAEEVLARNRDYQSLGWQVVWILHDQRYNQVRLSAAEIALSSSPHFFTNMDALGTGIIYDQFDLCDKGLRLKRLSPLPVDVKELVPIEAFKLTPFPLILLKKRIASWKLSFAGDAMHVYASHPQLDYWVQALKAEKLFYLSLTSFKWKDVPIKLWRWGIAHPYRVFFRFWLERVCR